ncbi:MAG: hypothetical protein ACYDCM_07325 [Candidatus Acidiferrales bacterium]
MMLAKRLVSAIEEIRRAIQEQIKPVSVTDSTANEAENVKQGVPPLVRAEVNLPQGVEIHKSASDTRYEQSYQFRTLLSSWVSIGVAILTLASLIGYAIISYGQLREMREEQRPYVWLTSTGLGSPEYVPTGQILWDWHYTNYGKSPAYDIRWKSYISIDGAPFVRSYKQPKGGGNGSALPPTQDVFSTVISPPGVTQDQFKHAISIEGKGISIRIEMEYTDGLRKSRSQYGATICLKRLFTGAIEYCEGNNIK